ncbi:putative N-alkane-inducible cytochrome P450 [Pseudomassariella vexata]|uniref:Putative N-alkane-inducible cytochrome P450 n=1 Tax=Pseudomassariella vexata TaxID=1141098 RepID=A0A1Y2E779_9PEZI|nr:putative N-alkane-inducible cytochrome P450 [Pseudomassariella vexata]ORY67418.1 putative N-alkane-inducible cytochrome P450 [Pseudomassariella vexata]
MFKMLGQHIPLLAIGGLFLYVLCRSIVESLEARRFSKKHGCQPAPRIHQSSLLFGLDLFKKLKHDIENRTRLEENTRYALVTGNRTSTAVVLGQSFVSTTDPENVKAVLATNFNDYGIGPRISAFGPLLGRGIFTADDVHWEHSRALIRPGFTRAQVADLDSVETHVQNLLKRLPPDGVTVDLQPLFFNLTIDNATDFLFGQSINCQASPEGSEAWNFAEAFDNAQIKLQKKAQLGKLAFLLRDPECEHACRLVHQFVDSYIRKALGPSGHGTKTGRYNLLNELAAACPDEIQLRNELLNVLLAARDTTASLLSSIFYFLARYPTAWTRLSEEVNELHGEFPDYEKLKNMRYLKSVLNETLRLLPPVPTNTRFARAHTVLPRGGGPKGLSPVFVAKGTPVFYSVYTMHRLPEIYGYDAAAFRPERWLAESPPLRPGWGFLPFNGGPRICLGQQSALTEASYTVVRLLQTFDRLAVRDEKPWQENLGLTMSNFNGTKVALWKRA